MIGWLRDFRVVPVVLAAITVLFALKTLGLVLDGSYTLGDLARFGENAADITGSVDAPRRSDDLPAPPPKTPRGRGRSRCSISPM